MIIHIGLHKTGTTFLQRQVFAYINKDIISEESLSGYPINSSKIEYEKRMMLLMGIHRMYGRKTKIILGVRDKDSWTKSCYNQYIYGGLGGFYNYKKWFDNVFDKRLLDFDSYISFINNNFDNVFIYNFEDFVKDKHKVIQEMLKFMGVDSITVDKILNNLSDKIYNRRLGVLSLQVFRLNNFLKELYKYVINFGRV
ncbi:MAG: hypothetical protein BV457_05425 [Thermoplasmata archaeon M9B1D]|nr:MAG: hypothetical protein BV457_05425 [Thermoplasmata archaeon M9B1D]PNX50256.1 MAG: hypothetical protein BV456_07275 [Thermoplasmata archaeon M8B2D]